MYSYSKVTVTEKQYTKPRTNPNKNAKKEEPMTKKTAFESTEDVQNVPPFRAESVEDGIESNEGVPVTGVPVGNETSQELQDAHDDYKRLMAEYANYRNRVEREKTTAGHNATFKAVQAVMPVLDDIELALKHDSDNIPEPVQRIFSNLIVALESIGLDIVNESGVEFDPTIHEGVLYQEVEGVEPEHIAQVLRTGYRMTNDNRVIRGAQVIIAK